MEQTVAEQQALINLIRERSYPLMPQPTEVEECGTRLPGIKAVLFDIYGTLIVSGSGDVGTLRNVSRQAAFRHALERCVDMDPETLEEAAMLAEEVYFTTIEEHHARRRTAGVAHPEVEIRDVWRAVVHTLRDRGYLVREMDQDGLERLALEYELAANPTWPMPEAVETLKELSATLPVGVVSNAQFYTPLLFAALANRSLEELGVDPELCVFSFRFGEAKPSPSLFEPALGTLARRNGVAKDEVLYVGNDMLNDMWAATVHGMRTCLFAGDKRSLRLRENDDVVRRVRPDAVVNSLGAVLRLIGIGETA